MCEDWCYSLCMTNTCNGRCNISFVSMNIGDPVGASACYGADKQNWSKNSNKETLAGYEGKLIPTLVIGAELDPAEVEWGTYPHIAILCEKRKGCTRYTQLRRQNHISEVLNLNTDDHGHSCIKIRKRCFERLNLSLGRN